MKVVKKENRNLKKKGVKGMDKVKSGRQEWSALNGVQRNDQR